MKYYKKHKKIKCIITGHAIVRAHERLNIGNWSDPYDFNNELKKICEYAYENGNYFYENGADYYEISSEYLKMPHKHIYMCCKEEKGAFVVISFHNKYF